MARKNSRMSALVKISKVRIRRSKVRASAISPAVKKTKMKINRIRTSVRECNQGEENFQSLAAPAAKLPFYKFKRGEKPCCKRIPQKRLQLMATDSLSYQTSNNCANGRA